jgi:hypothetical protein
MKISGGMLAMYAGTGTLEWVAIQQADNRLTLGVVMDGVETFNFKVTFNTDETVKIDLCSDESVMSSATYQRDASPAGKADEKTSKTKDSKAN